MTAPPAEAFVKNREWSEEGGEKVELSGADQSERGGQNQEKNRSAEELLRRERLGRTGDGGGHRLSLQDNIRPGTRDFVGRKDKERLLFGRQGGAGDLAGQVGNCDAG